VARRARRLDSEDYAEVAAEVVFVSVIRRAEVEETQTLRDGVANGFELQDDARAELRKLRIETLVVGPSRVAVIETNARSHCALVSPQFEHTQGESTARSNRPQEVEEARLHPCVRFAFGYRPETVEVEPLGEGAGAVGLRDLDHRYAHPFDSP